MFPQTEESRGKDQMAREFHNIAAIFTIRSALQYNFIMLVLMFRLCTCLLVKYIENDFPFFGNMIFSIYIHSQFVVIKL